MGEAGISQEGSNKAYTGDYERETTHRHLKEIGRWRGQAAGTSRVSSEGVEDCHHCEACFWYESEVPVQ